MKIIGRKDTKEAKLAHSKNIKLFCQNDPEGFNSFFCIIISSSGGHKMLIKMINVWGNYYFNYLVLFLIMAYDDDDDDCLTFKN